MKIAINAGHTISGKGTGAVGYLTEGSETRRVVKALIPILQARGVEVIDATVDKAASNTEYLQKAVTIANNAKADLFISIHFNAGGGNGCECFTWRGNKLKQAQGICDRLKALGFRDRGVKDGSAFYVIKNTKMPAVLVETCFVDSRGDYELYRKLGVERVAAAIADGITKGNCDVTKLLCENCKKVLTT